MKNLTKILSGCVVAAAIGLTGCGGGGGSSSAAAPANSGGGSNNSNNNDTVQGIATPSSVSVVTAQNASAGG